MSAKQSKAAPVSDETHVSMTPADWEFETVVEESPTTIVFDTIGDVFVGQYIGTEHIDLPLDKDGKDQSFDRYTFRGRDGELYALNQSYKIEMGMDKAAPGQWVRITYVKDIPTSRGLQPMKDFRIEVRK
jgi:hypothetical protein